VRLGLRWLMKPSMPPVSVAFSDCFTRLGGNQYHQQH
jgi:hypothetical protein